MKKPILLGLSLSLALAASAQNQNWTATAIDGSTISMQTYLSQGKTVLVDISAHWCPPCWSWHTSGIMEQLYHDFGPGGTNDLVIVWVDGDAASSIALLQGASGSQGDWTDGAEYPLIGPNGEGNVLANLYNITAYPTLFMHCPGTNNGAGVEVDRQNFWPFFNTWRTDCPAPFQNAALDVTLMQTEGGEACPGDQVTPSTVIYNQGTTAVTSATLKLKQNGTTLQTVNWTGSLAAGGYATANFNPQTITGFTQYQMEVSSPNGQADQNNVAQSEEITYTSAQPVSWSVTVEGKVDGYGSEFSWRMLDPNGVEVAEGGNTTVVNETDNCDGTTPAAGPGSYANNATFTEQIDLTELGCYKVEAFDSYGDGLLSPGYFRVRNSNSQIVVNVVFSCVGEASMANDAVGVVENSLDNSLSLYPNPTNGLVNVAFKLNGNEQTTIRVMNVLGQEVMSTSRVYGNGAQNTTLDMSALHNGVYYFVMQSGDLKATRKITLTR